MMIFKDFNVLPRNVRGAASARVKRRLKSLLVRYKPSLVFIMEIHVKFSKVKNFRDSVGYITLYIVEARVVAMQVGYGALCRVIVLFSSWLWMFVIRLSRWMLGRQICHGFVPVSTRVRYLRFASQDGSICVCYTGVLLNHACWWEILMSLS